MLADRRVVILKSAVTGTKKGKRDVRQQALISRSTKAKFYCLETIHHNRKDSTENHIPVTTGFSVKLDESFRHRIENLPQDLRGLPVVTLIRGESPYVTIETSRSRRF